MVYGVKIFNYLKGWYEVHIFKKRKIAEAYKKALEEMDWNVPYTPLSEYMIASEDELSKRNPLFKNDVTKNYNLSVASAGHVRPETHNIRIINNNDPVEIPA